MAATFAWHHLSWRSGTPIPDQGQGHGKTLSIFPDTPFLVITIS